MSVLKFKIDEKSLYYGTTNDYARGQTATVHTPINQSSDPSKWHRDILQLKENNLGYPGEEVPEPVKNKCLPTTTSHAQSQLDYLFIFDKISFDGKPLKLDCSFAMYIKKEIDKFIVRRNGEIGPNAHIGRLKLHYPISLHFDVFDYHVDNKRVLKSILENNGKFAYVVRGFEYDTESKVLNFVTSLVGPMGIPLSNVFKRQKGTGKKLLLNEVNQNVLDFIQEYVVDIQPKSKDVQQLLNTTNEARVANGKLGEELVLEKIKNMPGVTEVHHTSEEYPFSPYDIEYIQNGIRKYAEVKATQGKKKIFNMSSGEIKFMRMYSPYYTLFLVMDIKTPTKSTIIEYSEEDINKMDFEHPSTRFYAS